MGIFFNKPFDILSEVKKAALRNKAHGSAANDVSGENSHTEYTHRSFGTRIVSSFTFALLGVALFFGSFLILWKNEGHAVGRMKKELYIERNAVEVPSFPADRNNDDKLIAVSGSVSVNNSLIDGTLSVQNALILKRTVEMYQWDERKSETTQKHTGGSATTKTTYSYRKIWSEQPIDSSGFKKSRLHTNPPMPLQSDLETASSANLGDFKITTRQIEKINNFMPLTRLPDNPDYTTGNGFYYTKDGDPNAPKIGDLKISYEFVPSGTEVSFLGKQTESNRIKEMKTPHGSIYLQYDGCLSKEQMLERFKRTNSLKTYSVRLIGILLMWIGLVLILSPLKTLLSFFPFPADIFSVISGTALFLPAICLSCLTIAAAWMAYRPVFAVGIAGIALVVILLIRRSLSDKKEKTDKEKHPSLHVPDNGTLQNGPISHPEKQMPLDVITR